MDSVLVWSAGEAGPPESIPGLDSGEAFQQGDLALIALSGDHRPRRPPGINSRVLRPDTCNYCGALFVKEAPAMNDH